MGGRSLPPQFWSSPHLHGGTGGNQLADAHRTAPPPSPRTRRTHPARHPPSAPHAHHLTHALAAILSVILGAIPTPAPNPNQASPHLGPREVERDSAQRESPGHQHPAACAGAPPRPIPTHTPPRPPPSRNEDPQLSDIPKKIFRPRPITPLCGDAVQSSVLPLPLLSPRTPLPHTSRTHTAHTPAHPFGWRWSGDEDTSPAESALLS